MGKKKLFIVLMILPLYGLLGYMIFKQIFEDTEMNNRNYDVLKFFQLEDLQTSRVKEGYRFHWRRTFHYPVVATVIIEEEKGILNVKVSDGKGGYDPGKIFVDKEIVLTEEQIDDLRSVVNDNPFWKDKIERYITLDGATWTVEVKQNGKYYVDYEQSPESGSIRNIGMHLLKLSRLGLDPNDIY